MLIHRPWYGFFRVHDGHSRRLVERSFGEIACGVVEAFYECLHRYQSLDLQHS
jgi:hypothetical protein